jgi:hypothetical protein
VQLADQASFRTEPHENPEFKVTISDGLRIREFAKKGTAGRRRIWVRNTGRVRIQPTIRAERKSPAREDAAHFGGQYVDFSENQTQKEQGRRRSMTLTALPAPDIEIGLRRPGEPHLASVSHG